MKLKIEQWIADHPSVPKRLPGSGGKGRQTKPPMTEDDQRPNRPWRGQHPHPGWNKITKE